MLSVPGGDHEGSLDELSHMPLDEILRGKQPPFWSLQLHTNFGEASKELQS